MNLCLSACDRVVVNNTHCRNWPGDVDIGNEQLCIIHSDADGQFFYVVDSGLRVKLTELWIKKQ